MTSRRVILSQIRSVIEDHGLTADEIVGLLELDALDLLRLLPNRFIEYKEAFVGLEDEDE